MKLYPLISDLLPALRERRRALHRIPEEGYAEEKTKRYLVDTLARFEPDALQSIAGGVRIVFRGNGSGRNLAFRADMDALPLTEQATHDFASRHLGVMHACGHDGHMAVLMTLAELLSAHRKTLRDTVTLLFQPAEESIGGAKPMVEGGAMRNPDVQVVYGLHMMPDLPLGTLGTAIGPLMSGTCEFDIALHGRAAHGAAPQDGVDTIVAVAALIQALQGMITRTINPTHPAVLTVGRLTAGDRRNIIAEQARLECTMRAFDDATMDAIRAGIRRHLRGVEESFGIKCGYRELITYPPVVNDETETRRAMRLLGDYLQEVPPKMIAEDFSYYQREAPGVFFFLGCGDETHKAPLHSPRFNFDEAALCYGLQAFWKLIDRTEA